MRHHRDRPKCPAPPTPSSATPFSASSKWSAATTAALANCARTSSAPTGRAKRSLSPGNSPEKAQASCRNGAACGLPMSETPAHARDAGTRVARIAPSKPASATSISTSMFTCASGGEQRTNQGGGAFAASSLRAVEGSAGVDHLPSDRIRVHRVLCHEILDEVDGLRVQRHRDTGGLGLPLEFRSMSVLVDQGENVRNAVRGNIDRFLPRQIGRRRYLLLSRLCRLCFLRFLCHLLGLLMGWS